MTTDYNKAVNFQQEEQNLVAGRSTVRTAALDAELAAIEASINDIVADLGLIQRDDGELRDGVVKLHTLSADVLALMASATYTVRGGWLTATGYAVGDIVTDSAIAYLCVTAHTSGTFATDLAAGKWVALTVQSATNVQFSPTSTISAATAQAAIEELDTDLRAGVLAYLHQSMGGI